jgi:hypothetical protein
VLSSSQSVGGTRLSDGAAGNGSSYTGDTASSLFSGSWQAGDRIIVTAIARLFPGAPIVVDGTPAPAPPAPQGAR